MTFIKLRASVGDTDFLINVTKSGRIDIFENLFNEVIIPAYIAEREMINHGSDERYFLKKYKRLNPMSPIVFKDREKEGKLYNKIALTEFRKMLEEIDKGEAECCGYARASNTNIILSDNKRDYPEMENAGYILLGHREILTLNVFYGLMTRSDCETIYNSINTSLSAPSAFDFNEIYDRALNRIRTNGWNKHLNIK